MPGWASLKDLVREEITQREQEGCAVAGFEERWQAAASTESLMQLYRQLSELPVGQDFPYCEPSHLGGIRACRMGEHVRRPVDLDARVTLDRYRGAWLGRIAGCMLGKPVEGWSKEMLQTYLEAQDAYPLSDYVSGPKGDLPAGVGRAPSSWSVREAWDHALMDDDTNYTVLGLKILQEKGPDFTTAQVGWMWLQNLPYNHVCTAEKQAYMNLVAELPIEQVPRYLNPYREWIGAQIRADFWGYCAPGWPEKAAEFAYRDAALSHVKNGIYGEMFCAAAISAAFVADDAEEIVRAGLEEIPQASRLAETVRDCLRWRETCATWEEAYYNLMATYYGRYSTVHTNNNLAAVLIALLYGLPDFEKVVTISVMQGLDTDCNGATAGSIAGAALGASAIPMKWTDPLGGRLDTSIFGFPCPSVDELVARTLDQARVVQRLEG